MRIFIVCLFYLLIATLGNESFAMNSTGDTIFMSSKSNFSEFAKVKGSNGLRTVIYLKNDGIYYIGETLEIPSNVEIIGNGSVLKPILNWAKGTTSDTPLISFVGKKNIVFKGLTIDFQGNNRKDNRIYCGLLLLASNNITIQNVNFKNGGSTLSSPPNSPYILIAAQDSPGDVSSLPKSYKNIIGSSYNNVIKNNLFDNTLSTTRFGIRVLTNWSMKRLQQNFKNKSYNNIIEGNRFLGEFSWNTVELAGGGTVKNKIFNNYVKGRAVNMLDIDKGASYNIIEKNTIEDSGLPERYKNEVNVRCSPISVQGMMNNYYSQSNQVLNNTIRNISNPKSNNSKYYFSSAIMTSIVNGVIIKGNKISNIYQDGSYQKGKNYGFGIAIHDFSNNVEIESNTIDKVNIAIGANWQKGNGEAITIRNNNIDFVRQAIREPNSSLGKSKFNMINNTTKSLVR
ncbi:MULTISPECIES: hypothetical protein [unclassified Sphingobacterium]|uniref:hypothetical protein n=1 Tax=unclassified Sphingobacterium TaxID=2609468 RepID=UPI0025E51505|nr:MULTISPECIES: hypothetical protein [unclassified Sphingobacterium]